MLTGNPSPPRRILGLGDTPCAVTFKATFILYQLETLSLHTAEWWQGGVNGRMEGACLLQLTAFSLNPYSAAFKWHTKYNTICMNCCE